MASEIDKLYDEIEKLSQSDKYVDSLKVHRLYRKLIILKEKGEIKC